MDDKRKRELSAAVDRGPTDAATQKLVAKDPQAKAYFDGLLTVDRALRAWPAREPSAVDSFLDSVLARLDEPSSSDFDPLSAPFADERELETPPRHHSEQQAMSQSNDQDNEDDLEGLAALMRPSRTGSSASVPPPPVSVRPGPALTDDAMDESSGIVDIKHLASIAKRASIPPATESEAKPEAKADAPSEEKPAEAKADAKKSDDKDAKDSAKKSDAKAESKGSSDSAKKGSSDGAKKADKAEAGAKKSSDASEKKVLQAVPAASASESSESKKGTSPVVWIGVIGIAAAGAFFVGRQGNQSAPSVNAEQAPQSANAATPTGSSQSAAPSAPSGSSAVAAPVAANAPAAQPAAPSQPETPTQPAAAPPPVDLGATGAGSVATQPTPTAAPSTGSAAIGGALGATGSGAQGSPAESEAANERSARRAPSGASAGSGGGARDNSVQEQRAQAAAEPARPPGNAAASPTTTTTRTTTAASASTTAPTTPTASTTPTPPAGRGSSTATGSAASEGAPAAGAGGTGARPRSVEELMRAATGADRAEARARENQQTAAAQTAALPPQLTTTMVRSTMSPFNSQVRACAQGQTGSATAVITVSGDGSVQNVVVSSPWGSGPNECISNRLRTARFPAVQRATSRVVVPFQVNPSQPGG